MARATVSSLVQEAFSLKGWQVVGPDWLTTDWYELAATMPPDTPRSTGRLMVQALLRDRFRLAYHREMRESPVYALVVAKGGLKIEPIPAPDTYSVKLQSGAFTAIGISMASFADALSARVDLPVIDDTGLRGSYPIDLHWTPDFQGSPNGWDAAILTAVNQIGLRLERRKVRKEVLVIDGIERKPTEN